MLEVIEPGLLTTVQDFGRPDAVDLGVPIGGACDPSSLVMANLQVGNRAGDAALEMTLLGASFRVLEDCLIAVAGAAMEGAPVSGRMVRQGEAIRFGAAVDGTGVRTYLAISGGVDVPVVLGSRSTCLVGGFGGFEGRALRAADVIRSGAPMSSDAPDLRAPHRSAGDKRVRIVAGRDEELIAALVGTTWRASARGNRQGFRLEGPPISVTAAPTMLSRGVSWGTVQVPPDGQPIVLLADAQTVGGYPVAGVVITADRPVIGQLAPGEDVEFVVVSIADAQQARREQAAQLENLVGGA